jgi:hypothetical protein
MPVCGVCGKIVKDLRRHKARGRCTSRERSKGGMPARFVPGTPENRLGMDAGGFSYIGNGAPADFTGARKRMIQKKR